MPRPKKNRIVNHPPIFSGFKPKGIRGRDLPLMLLSLDEFEAIRLADYQGLEHETAAEEMDISRSTFTRLLEDARAKTATMLIEGAELSIAGGSIHFRTNRILCCSCGEIFTADFFSPPETCPVCGSDDLDDLAGGYGHGPCCGRFHSGRGAKRQQASDRVDTDPNEEKGDSI